MLVKRFFQITIALSVAFFSKNSYGQQFLNGSFEKTSADESCHYNLSNSDVNSKMENTTAFGKYEAVDILMANCIIDNIADGKFAIGIANEPSSPKNSEAISLELSSPLVIGQTYKISFKVRSITKYGPQGDLNIGCSSSKNHFGTNISTVKTIADKWIDIQFEFYAENDDNFITVMPVSGVKSWNIVDDFVIKVID